MHFIRRPSYLEVPTDISRSFGSWLVYQEEVKASGLLTAVSGVFLQGGQHGNIGAAAVHEDDADEGDAHVTYQRVLVLEERTGDPGQGTDRELHVAASSKFAVSRRNLPCKQRMVLETPLKVKPGQRPVYKECLLVRVVRVVLARLVVLGSLVFRGEMTAFRIYSRRVN